jgi:hypothetical protein
MNTLTMAHVKCIGLILIFQRSWPMHLNLINLVTAHDLVTQNQAVFPTQPDWIKMAQEERDRVLDKRIKDRHAKGGDNSKSYLPPRRANMHSVDSWVGLDHIIDYTVMKHGVDYNDPNDDGKVDEDGGRELLAYMSGQRSPCGDVCQVLASKQIPDRNKKRQVHENNSKPSSATIDGLTYHLNKGETIGFQGNQYTAQMAS